MMQNPNTLLRIEALDVAYAEKATRLAERLKLPTDGESELVLQLGAEGLQIKGRDAGAVRVDFASGALLHRRKFGGGQGQMIAKAIGIQSGVRPTVLDATAGLGRDAFILASLGCQVTMVERHPVIAALLEEGIERARQDEETSAIMARMRLIHADAVKCMCLWEEESPQVVYLDPMFPERDKSALVKKEMRLFRLLAGDDDDAPALLKAALALATHRVVVKRHKTSSAIAGVTPGYVLQGQSNRFDIYPKKALQAKNRQEK